MGFYCTLIYHFQSLCFEFSQSKMIFFLIEKKNPWLPDYEIIHVLAHSLKRNRKSFYCELWRLFDVSQQRLIKLCYHLRLTCRRVKWAQHHSVASLSACHHQAQSSLIAASFSRQWPASIPGSMNAEVPAARLSVAQSSFDSGCLFKIVCQHLGWAEETGDVEQLCSHCEIYKVIPGA